MKHTATHHILVFLAILSGAEAFVSSWHQVRRRCTTVVVYAGRKDTCDVAVFGGGFGGLYTALAISRNARKQKKRVDVALVDPQDQFVFLPLLYDLTEGTATPAEVCPYYKDILADTGVRHIKGTFNDFSASDLHSANVTSYNDDITLSFRSSVVAVGATPESILASVRGASDLVQPFYTQRDAEATRELLKSLEAQISIHGSKPRIAIVGGGFGGVELAACVKRRLREADVTLLTRGPPMAGTRAEPLVDLSLIHI